MHTDGAPAPDVGQCRFSPHPASACIPAYPCACAFPLPAAEAWQTQDERWQASPEHGAGSSARRAEPHPIRARNHQAGQRIIDPLSQIRRGLRRFAGQVVQSITDPYQYAPREAPCFAVFSVPLGGFGYLSGAPCETLAQQPHTPTPGSKPTDRATNPAAEAGWTKCRYRVPAAQLPKASAVMPAATGCQQHEPSAPGASSLARSARGHWKILQEWWATTWEPSSCTDITHQSAI